MFSKKSLKVVIQNIEGEFYPGVSELTFRDLPIEVDLNYCELPSGISGKIKIYGVSKQHMAQITTIKWKTGFINQKAVRVYANDGGGERLLFVGNITFAVPDYSKAPDVCISIDACAGAYYNVKSVSPSRIEGKASARQVFRRICDDYGVLLDMDFDTEQRELNPRYNQSGFLNRINAAAKTFDLYVLPKNNSVSVFPRNGYSATEWKFDKSYYVGYPSFNLAGIEIKLDKIVFPMSLADFFFIPDSEISVANDHWKIIKINYKLSTKIGGKWLCTVSGVRVGGE